MIKYDYARSNNATTATTAGRTRRKEHRSRDRNEKRPGNPGFPATADPGPEPDGPPPKIRSTKR